MDIGTYVASQEKDGWVNTGQLRFHNGRLQQLWYNTLTPGLEWEEPLNIFRWRHLPCL